MLLLTSTNDKIQLITSAACAVSVHAAYVDKLADVFTPLRTNTLITTATTTDIVPAPAASTERNIQMLAVVNTHASTAVTVTVQHTDGTNVVRLYQKILQPSEELFVGMTTLLLTSDIDKLRLVSAGAALSLSVYVAFVENDAGTITPGRQNTLITTATTTDILASPAAAKQRNVQFVSVFNAHATERATISITHTDGTNEVVIFRAVLLPGQAVRFVEGDEFKPASVVISATAPIGVADDVLWWNSTTGILYVLYNDGSSQQWVQVTAVPSVDLDLMVRVDEPQTHNVLEKAQARTNISAATIAAMRNINAVVNGGMEVSEEIGSTAVTLTNNVIRYTVDQFQCYYKCATGVVAAQRIQNSSFPVAITNGRAAWGLRMQATTALASLVNDDAAFFSTEIEGYRVDTWQWGTASAVQIVVAFHLYSTGAGVAVAKLANAARTRFYYHEITVVAGWNFYAFLVDGDTAGTWEVTTLGGLQFNLFVAGKAAAVATPEAWVTTNTYKTTNSTENLLDTANDQVILTNLYIGPSFGGQLPTYDDIAFMMRPFMEERVLCQRYYRLLRQSSLGFTEAATRLNLALAYDPPMRIGPTLSQVGTLKARDPTLGGTFTAVGTITFGTTAFADGMYIEVNAGTSWGLSGGNKPAFLLCDAGSGIGISARF